MTISQYVESVISPMLSHPDALTIHEKQDQLGVLYTVTVHKEDMGMVVGKGGETAKALRLVVRIVGLKNNVRASLKINEPNGSVYRNKL